MIINESEYREFTDARSLVFGWWDQDQNEDCLNRDQRWQGTLFGD